MIDAFPLVIYSYYATIVWYSNSNHGNMHNTQKIMRI